jgi:hypothetical protein
MRGLSEIPHGTKSQSTRKRDDRDDGSTKSIASRVLRSEGIYHRRHGVSPGTPPRLPVTAAEHGIKTADSLQLAVTEEGVEPPTRGL